MSESILSTVRPLQPRPGTRRETYLAWLHERYPTFEPRNDYELVSIVETNFCGPVSELRATMDNQLTLDTVFAAGFQNLEDAGRISVARAADIKKWFISQAKRHSMHLEILQG